MKKKKKQKRKKQQCRNLTIHRPLAMYAVLRTNTQAHALWMIYFISNSECN